MIPKKERWKRPLRCFNIDRMPDDAIGVYAFWCQKSGRCLYVGKAEQQSIRERVKREWRDSHNKQLKFWIKKYGKYLEICYLTVPYDRMHKVDNLETKLIRLWNPETNKNKKRS